MKLPLNLIIFCTTAPKYGHGNNTENYKSNYTYEKTINSLFDQVDKNLFKNKLLHLKSREGEEGVADNIKNFCDDKDIRVIETKENFEHHSDNALSHAAGYFKDIYKAFSDLDIRKQKYSLWLEDDYLFRLRMISLEEAFKQSIKFLDNNPEQLCVRFNLGLNFTKAVNSIKESHNIFTQDLNYTQYGPTFTFQPNISRTTDIFVAWRAAQNLLHKLEILHCELVSGEILKTNLTNSPTPFSFFNPKKIFSEHIG